MTRIAPMLLCLSLATLAACGDRPPGADATATQSPAATQPPETDVIAPAPVAPTAPDVAAPAASAGTDQHPLARDACLAEVARKAGVPAERLQVTEVLAAEAGIGVTVRLPGGDGATWSCLSDAQGQVQGAAPVAVP